MTRTIALTVVFATACGVAGPARAPASDTDSIYASLGRMKDHVALYVAVNEANAAAMLNTERTYTLFAPSDAAFKKLSDADVKTIVTDKDAVRKLVRAHIVKGEYTTKGLAEKVGENLPTLDGGTLKVERVGEKFRVGGATITAPDQPCSNGVIHVVDAVVRSK
jgi:uncharacterized surface protein with fasciclin (FAS1) repeats